MTGKKIYFGFDLNISSPLSAKRHCPALKYSKNVKLSGHAG
jgi:hypothetical protein